MARRKNDKDDAIAPNRDGIGLTKRCMTMSNALTRAGHGIDLAAKRLVGLALTKIDSKKAVSPLIPVLVTRFTAQEYSEAFDVDISVAYRALAEGAEELKKSIITFYTPAYKRSGEPISPTRHMVSWARKASYQKDEGWVEIHWDQDVIPHLTGLKKHFTTVLLSQTAGLRSVYSWRLLEQMEKHLDKQFGNGWWQVTIEDFCETMQATPKQRTNFNNLRRRMIEPAVKELTEKDGWIIAWAPIKAGRKVKSLKFEFSHSGQAELPL